MDRTADQVVAEIEELRQETDIIVDELERRVSPQNLIHVVTTMATEAASSAVNDFKTTVSEAVSDMPEMAEQNRPALAGAGISMLTGLGVTAFSAMMLGNRDPAAERELDTAGLPEIEPMPRARRVRVVVRREEPGMLKRVLWIALASGMAALGSMLFRRLTVDVWRSTMREEPPEG